MRSRGPANTCCRTAARVRDAVRAAGGYTAAAYIYAAELTRESVQKTQQENYDRALRDLETDLARTAGTQRVSGAEEARHHRPRHQHRPPDRATARAQAGGRIVLEMPLTPRTCRTWRSEDGDRILIPARPNTVGVFGSVYNAATYLHQAGGRPATTCVSPGPTKGADETSVFVVRANGNVISGRQNRGWFRRGNVRPDAPEPGDTIFVPEGDGQDHLPAAREGLDANPSIQLGLGLAAFKSLPQQLNGPDALAPVTAVAEPLEGEGPHYGLLDLVLPIAQHWVALTLGSLVVGLIALGLTFPAAAHLHRRTTLLPPQQQGPANALLGSLGNLAGLAGGAAALRTPGDQYVAMLGSQRVGDALIDRFDLMKVYESEFRFQARQALAGSSRIDLGKKDGLISIEVEDRESAARRRHRQPICRGAAPDDRARWRSPRRSSGAPSSSASCRAPEPILSRHRPSCRQAGSPRGHAARRAEGGG